jgi:nitric oxide synthase-interacting protein
VVSRIIFETSELISFFHFCSIDSPKGHLFCKECIYDSLISQKKEIKRQVKAWEEQEKLRAADTERQREKEEDARILQFTKSEGSILPPPPSQLGTAQSGFSAPGSAGSSAVLVFPSKLEDHVAGSATLANDPRQLRAYWLPSLAPDASSSTVDKPSEETKCPMGHVLRLKQLIKVDFTPIKGVDQADDTKFGRFMCSSCMKGVNSVSALVLSRPCGHVVCKGCFDKFGKAAKGGETPMERAPQCCVCSMKLISEKDVVHVQGSGTSFAAGGGDAKVATKESVVPRFG